MEHEYSNEHQAILELLPWYANNTLAEPERQLLQAHLHDCIACRGELKRFQVLQECLHMDESEMIASQAFDELMRRIETAEASSKWRKLKGLLLFPVGIWKDIRCSAQSVKWAMALQCLMLFGFGFVYLMFVFETPEAHYKTLSSTRSASSDHQAMQRLRVVFSGTAEEQSIRKILQSIDANIIAGPTVNGVYTLSLSNEKQASSAVLDMIRAFEQVEFAEYVITHD